MTASSSQTSHDGNKPQPPARLGGLFRHRDDRNATTASPSGELRGRQKHTRAPRIAEIHDLDQLGERRSDTLPRFSKEALQQVRGAGIGAPARPFPIADSCDRGHRLDEHLSDGPDQSAWADV